MVLRWDKGETRIGAVLVTHYLLLCSMFPAPPLTLEHIMPLIWRVHNWHSRKNGFLTLLGISESKRQVVRELVGYDDNKVVPKCIEWWLHYGTFVSWRDLIYCLDRAGEVLVANDIREYAEPQTGEEHTMAVA